MIADLDHTVPWEQFGLTEDPNLGAMCHPDHCLKHAGRWRVRQTSPGHFDWTGPSGHHYRRARRPLLRQLPDPVAGATPPAPVGPDELPDDTEDGQPGGTPIPILAPAPRPEPRPMRYTGPSILDLLRTWTGPGPTRAEAGTPF